MKKYTLLLFLCFGALHANLWDYINFADANEKNAALVPAGKAEKAEQLNHLKAELATLTQGSKEFFNTTQSVIDQTNAAINDLKNSIKNSSNAQEREFLNKKMAVLNELVQVLFNVQLERKQLQATLEKQIKLLEEFLKDPDFKALTLKRRSFYPFPEFQNLSKGLISEEEALKVLQDKKVELQADLENRKRKRDSATKEYTTKQKEREALVSRMNNAEDSDQKFTYQMQLAESEEKLALYEKQLAELRFQEATRALSLLETTIFVESERFKVLKNNFMQARSVLRIDDSELQAAKAELNNVQQTSLAVREGYFEEVKKLAATQEELRKQLERLSKRFSVPVVDNQLLFEWRAEPSNVEEYYALCEVGYYYEQIRALEGKIDLLRAQIALEEAKFRLQRINVMAMQSWYLIVHKPFGNSKDAAEAMAMYRDLKAQTQRDLAVYKEKRAALNNVLSLQSTALNNVRIFGQRLQAEQDRMFKRFPLRYATCLTRLTEIEALISEQIDASSKLIEVYSALMSTLQTTQQDAETITKELETKNLWQRSEYAISWEGIKQSIPDFFSFVAQVYRLHTAFVEHTQWNAFKNLWAESWSLLLLLLIKLAVIILLGIILHKLCKVFALYAQAVPAESRSGVLLKHWAVMLLNFAHAYMASLYIWTCIFIYLQTHAVDVYINVLFYLLSIIYLIVLSNKFVQYTIRYNTEHDYALFTQAYTRRFIFVFSLFSYLTIIIFMFRQAFMLAMFHDSELPTILLAGYSIILRTLIIFSIGKDEIVSFIPARGAFWQWLTDVIERYYYLLLLMIIVIMIMSDPYVGGYGNLVSYILWGLIGTVVIVKGLMFLHRFLKRVLYHLFFSVDEEFVQERFIYAKTWYGLLVIGMFIFWCIVGIFALSYLWGKPISLSKLAELYNMPQFITGYDENKNPIYFTLRTLTGMFAIIFAGIVGALVCKRLVLKRIFEVLPADSGVQYTISAIVQFLIIVVAICTAFKWANLITVLIGLGAVIVGIGYIYKEPISDFISYFIILVQRPIKVDDFISIDENTRGVVRHITPRAVILRKNNAYNVILPNSFLLTRPLSNWNYSRNVVAFEDISFAVPYSTDPMVVKQVLESVLAKNVNILKSPKPIIRLDTFGENGFVFMVRGYLSETKTLEMWDIASDVRFAITKALLEKNITIAVPTRVITQVQSASFNGKSGNGYVSGGSEGAEK